MQACTTPAVLTGYEVDETELNPAQFAVVASCAEGYEGTATVAACGEGGGEYTLGGCSAAAAEEGASLLAPVLEIAATDGVAGKTTYRLNVELAEGAANVVSFCTGNAVVVDLTPS